MVKKLKNDEKIKRMRIPGGFTKIYATNSHCGMTNQDIRIEFTNEKIKDDGSNWTLLIDAMVILSPIGAKKLSERLKKVVSTYEEKNGKIKIDIDDMAY